MTGTSIRKSGPDGFTLLEIVISIGLIAIALMAVFRLQANNLDLQAEARFVTVANQLAQERMAGIRAMSGIAEGTSTGSFEEPFTGYLFQEDVTKVSDREGLYEVRVSIMQEKAGQVKDLTMTGYLYHSLEGAGGG